MKKFFVSLLFLSIPLQSMHFKKSVSTLNLFKQCTLRTVRSIAMNHSRNKENNYQPIISAIKLSPWEQETINFLKELKTDNHELQIEKIAHRLNIRYGVDPKIKYISHVERFVDWYKKIENFNFDLTRTSWSLENEKNEVRSEEEKINYEKIVLKIKECESEVAGGLESLLQNTHFTQVIIKGLLDNNRYLAIRFSKMKELLNGVCANDFEPEYPL